MVKPTLEPGATIDGFRIEESLHRGGMATLWRVSRAGRDDADADEGADNRGRRGSGGDRQLRNGADDPAAPLRRPRAEVRSGRRFRACSLIS